MEVRRVDWPSRLGASTELRHLLASDPTPDIYHLHGVWLRAMYYGAVEARRRQRPYVVELMGAYEKYPLRQKWLLKRISRRWFQDALLRRAGCLHVNSHDEASALRELGFRVPIAVIPVGVDIETIDAQADKAGIWSYPELNNRPFVLYLARIHAKKGIELLLRAWASVVDSFPEHCLVVVGKGESDYVKQCQQLASDLHIANRCYWLGQVGESEKIWLYRNAAVYVLPSYSENFGNTVAEAMAQKTPVITTPHTPWTHLPEEGCGWIANTSVDALHNSIAEALGTNSSERRRMGERGRYLVERRYSLRSVIKQIDSMYAWMLGGPKPDDILV